MKLNVEKKKKRNGVLMSRMACSLQVVNLYLELLKEREKREPEKFLKCHFFSTFFYNKVSSLPFSSKFEFYNCCRLM